MDRYHCQMHNAIWLFIHFTTFSLVWFMSPSILRRLDFVKNVSFYVLNRFDGIRHSFKAFVSVKNQIKKWTEWKKVTKTRIFENKEIGLWQRQMVLDFYRKMRQRKEMGKPQDFQLIISFYLFWATKVGKCCYKFVYSMKSKVNAFNFSILQIIQRNGFWFTNVYKCAIHSPCIHS